MKVQDLDEWQGLTRQMIISHLNHTGWSSFPDGNHYLLKPAYFQLEIFGDFAGTIGRLAEIEGRTPQALLREINPRMRKGLPSESSRSAHRWWLAVGTIGDHRILSGYWENDDLLGPMLMAGNTLICGETLDAWSFWPCDSYGNKVPWPCIGGALP